MLKILQHATAMTRRATKKVRARTRNPPETRAKLLRATVSLMASRGIDALSVKDVARKAKVSRGVAYQHFADRDALMREARRSVSYRLMEAAIDIQPASLEERIRQVVDLVSSNAEASRMLVEDALAGENLGSDHPIFRLSLRMLEDFKASGDARADIDVEMMSCIMLGSISAIIMSQHVSSKDVDVTRRFTMEWSRVLRHGIFGDARVARKASPGPLGKMGVVKKTPSRKKSASTEG
jgi:AcrR family transcriptional regulator